MTPKNSALKIHIKKEALKFSAAHMTVFADGSKEALHGHNYSTEIVCEIHGSALNQMIPFSDFKSTMKKICASWDERVLLARQCSFLTIQAENEVETEFLLCNQRYVLPTSDIAWIEADNITVESLAEKFCHLFLAQLSSKTMSSLKKYATSIAITICEGPGQGATFSKKL